jgi:serine/threonine protein kinase
MMHFSTLHSTLSTDMYSLGCVLHQMLTGCLPLSSRAPGVGLFLAGAGAAATAAPSNKLHLVHAILTQIPSPPNQLRPAVPTVLANIIMKCIEKNPDDRYQSASEKKEKNQ